MENFARDAGLRAAWTQVRNGTRKQWDCRNHPAPPELRCQARAKHTKQRCRFYKHRWPDGTLAKTCRYHGALAGAQYGRKAWRTERRWNGQEFVEHKVLVGDGQADARASVRNKLKREERRQARHARRFAALGAQYDAAQRAESAPLEQQFSDVPAAARKNITDTE
jgi:hypothetical protein